MSFPAYDDYKDSGIEWVGKVPLHWETMKLGRVTIDRCDGPFGSGLKSSHYVDDGIRVIRLNNIRNNHFDDSDAAFIDPVHYHEELGGGHDVVAGDLLIAGLGDDNNAVGRACVAPDGIEPAMVKADCFRYRLDQDRVLPSFMSAQLTVGAPTDAGLFSTGTTRSRIPLSVTSSRRVALPPLDEQKAISSFLDVETSKIDGLVSEQRRLIELLKEKRQAFISHAVTKGLNPNAPMKPSGIQWLGDVPQHWDVKPLRRFNCNVQTGPFGSQLHADEYISGGTPVLNPTHMVNGGIVPSDDITVNDDVLERLPHQRLEVGDVIFSRRGELGRCALVTENEAGWLCGTGSMILRLHQAEYDGGYLSLFLSLDVLRQFFESFSIGSVMNSLSSETLLSMPLIVPPIEEQHQIVRVAMERATMIDQLQAEAERAIELLQERRTALISAAVTGKIDVREFAYQETA